VEESVLSPRPCVKFRNKPLFCGKELLAPRPTPELEDHSLSAVLDHFLSTFSATFRVWRPSPSSETRGRTEPW